MSELNPNHPVTKTMHDVWHKFAAILMRKFEQDHVVITLADLQKIPIDTFIVVQEMPDGLHFRFVDEKTANELARKHGGPPT